MIIIFHNEDYNNLQKKIKKSNCIEDFCDADFDLNHIDETFGDIVTQIGKILIDKNFNFKIQR